MFLTLLTCFLTAVAIVSIAALITTGSGIRRIVGVVVCVPALATPWMAPASMSMIRLFAGMAAIQGCMRIVELARERTPKTGAQRVLHAIGLVDTRGAKAAPRRLDAVLVTRFLVFGALAVLTFYVAVNLSLRFANPYHWVLRALAGAAFCYCVADSLDALMHAVLAFLGVFAPETHLAPIKSRTLWEFWGVRWNRNFSQYVYAHCFLPHARRGRAKFGIVLAFTVSSFVHAYFTTAAAGFWWGAAMFSYFFMQGVLVVVERKTGILKMTPAITRVWMVIAILLPSPLATEPLLNVINSAIKF